MGPAAGGPDVAGVPSQEMIPCREALALVYEYLDGELEDVSAEHVRVHFEVCQRCYPHLKLEESFRGALHRAAEGAGSAPPGLRERILGVLETESTG